MTGQQEPILNCHETKYVVSFRIQRQDHYKPGNKWNSIRISERIYIFYIGAKLNKYNDVKQEINITSKSMKSSVLNRDTKLKIYRSIIKPVMTYGYDITKK